MPQPISGFVQNVTKLQRDLFQLGCQPLVVVGRQCIEQMSLMGIEPKSAAMCATAQIAQRSPRTILRSRWDVA